MKKYVCILMLMIMICSVSAYEQLTGDEFTSYMGTSFFNDFLGTGSSNSVGLSSGQLNPLSGDLDGDGDSEIVVIEGTNLKIYSLPILTNIGSVALGCTADYSSFVITELDGNGLLDIVIPCIIEETVKFIEFDGENTTISSLNIAGAITHSDGDMLIGCSADDKQCVLAYQVSTSSSTSAQNKYYAIGLNKTDVGAENNYYTDTAHRVQCFPHIPYMYVGDFNSDGNIEYIFSVNGQGVTLTTSAEGHIFILSANPSHTVTLENTITVDTIEETSTIGEDCSNSDTRRHITSPLVADMSTSNNNEIVIGFQTDDNEFKMHIYDQNGNFIDDVPEATQTNGRLMSNPFLCDTFDDTGLTDFCVLGFDNTTNKAILLTGSELDTFRGQESIEFDLEGVSDIDEGYRTFSILTHTLNSKQELSFGNDPSEILTPWGVYELDYSLNNFEHLDLIYGLVEDNYVNIMEDFEGNGHADILQFTSTEMIYIDDGFTNTPAVLHSYTTNPCTLDVVIKQNETLNLRVKGSDDDNDNVCINATAYSGLPIQQPRAWACGVNGTPMSFVFTMNETISNGIIKININSTENGDNIDTTEFLFSVGTNGVEFGDCETSFINVVEGSVPIGGNCNTDSDCSSSSFCNATSSCQIRVIIDSDPDNVLTQGMNETAETTGIGVGVLWLILMVGLSYGIISLLTDAGHTDAKTVTPSLLLMNGLMVLIGAKLGYIEGGVIVTIVVICGIGIAVWVSRRTLPTSG